MKKLCVTQCLVRPIDFEKGRRTKENPYEISPRFNQRFNVLSQPPETKSTWVTKMEVGTLSGKEETRKRKARGSNEWLEFACSKVNSKCKGTWRNEFQRVERFNYFEISLVYLSRPSNVGFCLVENA